MYGGGDVGVGGVDSAGGVGEGSEMTDTEKLEEWCNDRFYFPTRSRMPYIVELMRDGGLTDEQILIALKAVNSTCVHCWDAPSGCRCWDDS